MYEGLLGPFSIFARSVATHLFMLRGVTTIRMAPDRVQDVITCQRLATM
jgi:hypothetical protein